jgi:hypothetical protein
VTRYQVNDFPHVAFIDPRTARLLWRKEGWTQENPLTAESFAEQAMDFCSRNSFDRPPAVPRPPGAKPPPVSQKRTVEAMTEDEQLEAAMQASIDDLAPATAASPEINGVAHLVRMRIPSPPRPRLSRHLRLRHPRRRRPLRFLTRFFNCQWATNLLMALDCKSVCRMVQKLCDGLMRLKVSKPFMLSSR